MWIISVQKYGVTVCLTTPISVVRFTNFVVFFRDKTTEAIINMVEYSDKFETYCYDQNKHASELLNSFARELYAWRRPYPKFRRSEASAYCI